MDEWLQERNIRFPIWYTSNSKGYAAIWEIQQDALWLIDFFDRRRFIEMGEEFIIDKNQGYNIEKLFDGKQKAMADWFTGTLEIVYGDALYYKYSGYAQVYAFERIIHIEKGKVLSEQIYDNRLFVENLKKVFPTIEPPGENVYWDFWKYFIDQRALRRQGLIDDKLNRL